MTQQEGPLISRLMRGSIVSNLTNATILCYPAASDASHGTSVLSGTNSYEFGSWVQFIGGAAASLVTSSFAVIGVVVSRTMTAGYKDMGTLQIGAGDSGSQEAIECIFLGRQYFYSGDTAYRTVYLPIPKRVDANEKVWIRMADDSSTAYTYTIKLVYTQNLRSGGQFCNNYLWQNNPNTAFTTSDSSVYSFGNWQTIYSYGDITTECFIRGVGISPNTSSSQYQSNRVHIQVGAGTAATLFPVAELPYYSETGTADHDRNTIWRYIPLSIMFNVPANNRIGVRVADDSSVARKYDIVVDIVKGVMFT